MIAYTIVGTNNIEKAAAFYDELLSLAGAQRAIDAPRMIAWGNNPAAPMFAIATPYDEKPATVGNGSMVAIAATDFTVSECPSYSVGDVKYSEASVGTEDSLIYGLSTAASADYGSASTAYRIDGEGWVGVTTYVDTHGELRVKKEVLVAMSGITTGNLVYPTPV